MLEIIPIRLRDYTGVIRRRYWIVLVLALAAALSAYVYSSRQQPVYQAGVRVSVTPNVMDYWTIDAVERLLDTYVDRMKTWEVAQRVVERKELDLPPGSVLSSLRTSIAPESYRVVIQAERGSARQAVDIVNGFADELVRLAESEPSSGPGGDTFLRAQVLDHAGSAGQVAPRPRFNVAVALVLGAIVGAALALAVEFIDARVRSREEAEHILGLPVIACTPPVPKSDTEPRRRPT